VSAPTLDVYNPASAAGVGVELAATSTSLAATVRANGAVVDLVSLDRAVKDRQAIGNAIAQTEVFFAPLVASAHQLHKAILARKQTILDPLEAADAERRQAISAFKAAEDQRRRDEEQRLADAQRTEREAIAAREAAALESAGEHDAAAAVMAETIATPPAVVVLPDATKGIAKFVRRYGYRIKDERLIPRDFLLPDEKKIGAYARAMKGTGMIPGVEFFHQDDPVR
jgi:hypothetical protein